MPSQTHPVPQRAPLLTVAEVAEILNISIRSARRLIANGTLPIIRIGSAVRVRPEALAALIDGE